MLLRLMKVQIILNEICISARTQEHGSQGQNLTNVKRDNAISKLSCLTKYSGVDFNVKIASAQPVFS